MKRLFLLFALLLSLPWGASAQTAITTTTLTNAITTLAAGQQNITIGSTTGITANSTFLYIDGSLYRVSAVVSSTVVTVQNYLFPATHGTSGVVVYVVPVGAQIALRPVGSCVRGGAGQFPAVSAYTLMFNTQDGSISRCAGTLGSRVWITTAPYVQISSTAPPLTP